MEAVKVILSGLWVAVMFLYQQGDMLRMYSGDFKVGDDVTRGSKTMTPETIWFLAALIMTIPIIMIILSLVLENPYNRSVNMVVAVLFFLYTMVGLPTYSGTYDKFLLGISLVLNALTFWYAWKWV